MPFLFMRYLLKPLICLCTLILTTAAFAQNVLPVQVLSQQETGKIQRSLILSVQRASQQQLPANHIPASQSAPARLFSAVPSSRFVESPVQQCQDTSVRTTYSKLAHWINAGAAISLSDGNILMVGTESDDTPNKFYSDPVLIKMTPYGDTLWMRKLHFSAPLLHNYGYRVFELRNGSILLAGGVSVPSTVNGREDLLLAMLSANGTLRWEKTFMNSLSRIYPNDGNIYIYDCGEDDAGNIFLCGSIRFGSPSDGGLLFSIDKNGTVRWSEKFGTRYYPYFTGMDVTGNNIRLFGHFVTESNLCTLTMMVNATTGDTLSATAWQIAGDKGTDTAFYPDRLTRLSNGNFAVYGLGYRNFYNFNHTTPVTRLV